MTRSTSCARTASVHSRSSTSSETTSALGMRSAYDAADSVHAVRETGVGDDEGGDRENPQQDEGEHPYLEVGQHSGHDDFSCTGGRKVDSEPAVLPEYSVQQQADRECHGGHQRIPELPVQLRHVVEV